LKSIESQSIESILRQLSLAVVAGDIFSWGWGKCPKVGHGPNILVSRP